MSERIVTFGGLRLANDFLEAESAGVRAAAQKLSEAGHRRRKLHIAQHGRRCAGRVQQDRLLQQLRLTAVRKFVADLEEPVFVGAAGGGARWLLPGVAALIDGARSRTDRR